MSQHGPAALAALTATMREHGCGPIPELLHHVLVASGGALLARLGCAGNPAALWERLTDDIARRLLSADNPTPPIAEWHPFPATMREFGAQARGGVTSAEC